ELVHSVAPRQCKTNRIVVAYGEYVAERSRNRCILEQNLRVGYEVHTQNHAAIRWILKAEPGRLGCILKVDPLFSIKDICLRLVVDRDVSRIKYVSVGIELPQEWT